MLDPYAVAVLSPLAAATAPNPWVTPLVGLAGVLFGGLLAGGFRLRGDKVARRAEAQRGALYDIQEGVLELRMALRKYGAAGARPGPEVTQAVDAANGKLDMLIQRLDDSQLRLHVMDWRDVAQLYWLQDESVSTHLEETAWLRVHYAAGNELRSLDRYSFERRRDNSRFNSPGAS